MKKSKTSILIGTAGWVFPEWKGTIYPFSEKKPLKSYSKIFNFVEINTTFYSIPDKNKVIKWLQTTPQDFKFSVKMYNQITHNYLKQPFQKQEKILNQFFSAITPLKNKIISILFQFPKTFSPNPKNNEYISNILEYIANTEFRNTIIVFEFRNVEWWKNKYVITWLSNYPFLTIAQTDRFTDETYLQYTDNTYIRLIGDRILIKDSDLGNKKINRNKDLERWATYIYNLYSQKKKILIIIGNHFSGNAGIDALYLSHYLSIRGLKTKVNYSSKLPPPALEQKSLDDY